MHEIDAGFRLRKEAGRARRRRTRRLRILAAAGLLSLGALLVAVALPTGERQAADTGLDEDFDMTPVAETLADDAPVYVPALVGLAGDPMIISFGGSADGRVARTRSVPRPAALAEETGVPARLELLSDTMLSSSERFMTTIPSSPEDFAFFQAQRDGTPGTEAAVAEALPDEVLAAGPAADFSDPAAGWGETIEDGEAGLPAFKDTSIDDTTTVASVTSEIERFADTEEIFVKVLSNRTLGSVLRENRFGADEARRADEALKALFGRDALEAGFVVAMRGWRAAAGGPLSLMQASIYAQDTYLGTLARGADGAFATGVDPWVRDDLFNYSSEADADAAKRQYRLLDAVYSTAARNSVPTGVTGEAIMYLSRQQDLNTFAGPDDRLVLLYSATPRDERGAGRVLYAAVRGPGRSAECFVYRDRAGAFACVGDDDQPRSLTVVNGMVTPVDGVLTSGFGVRKHPILGVVRKHLGVDWKAPVGTPVHAAFDGTVVFAGNGKGYGNVLRIAHAGGRETRYAHLSRFAPGAVVGRTVKAGDVVAYVGATGLATGPHLHFELRQGAESIDPLQMAGVAAPVADAEPGGSDDAAVEQLVNRIIRVESGGSATAKNPLSSATGLGQFIDGTWLRMMRTYRPDIARSLSRADLLALRFDPGISREMVRRLAQEGEAYLRARGHPITAGRLYLCHFLGMEGAHLVLSAAPGTALVDVLGSGVIRANPFLTGKNAADVANWAERKMRGHKGGPLPASPAPVTRTITVEAPPELLRYKEAVTALVSAESG